MTSRRIYLGLLTAFIGLFLTFQAVSTAHATAYDDGPHDHNGISCVIGTVAQADNTILPVSPSVCPTITNTTVDYDTAFVSAAYVTPQGRAPPPRSPPALIQ